MSQASTASDIFLSYAREDANRAKALASALQRLGYSVWWDPDIGIGDNYHRAIEDKLKQARVAIVLWSSDSIASDWVLAEASLARDMQKLLPVSLEDVEVPLSFRLLETADLRTWQGEEGHPGFKELDEALRSRLTSGPAPLEPSAKPAPTRKALLNRIPKPLLAARWLVLMTLLLIAVIVIFMQWRRPSEVEIDAIVSSVQFRTTGPESQALLQPTEVRSLALLGIEEVTLNPSAAAVADPGRWNIEDDSYPQNAWTAVSNPAPFTLKPSLQTRRADVTIRAFSSVFNVGPIRTDSIEISLDAIASEDNPVPVKSGVVSMRLTGQTASALTLPSEVRLDTVYCVRQESPLHSQPESAVLRMSLPDSDRVLRYKSSPSGLTFQAAFASSPPLSVLRGLYVDRLKFEQATTEGPVKTTINGDGTISFPGSGSQQIPLAKDDVLVLDDLRKFRIAEATLTTGGTLRLKMDGIAGKLRSGRPGFVEDRRPTVFDGLWKDNRLAALLAIVAAFLSFSVAARKYFAEINAP